MRVAVAGTFSVVHAGHLRLLKEAFRIGDEVLVGITSDAMAAKKGYDVPPLHQRMKVLDAHLQKIAGGKRYRIVVIEDEIGPAACEPLDAIVVSERSAPRALRINEIRGRNRLPPLAVHVVEMMRGEDGEVISASRVMAGEIAPDGRLRRRP
ncbi:MAG: pantetheine-phosphate adenylyltransferase [Candidatus Thermoplasmatota archaeon]